MTAERRLRRLEKSGVEGLVHNIATRSPDHFFWHVGEKAQRARERAQEILGKMATGINPNDEKRSKLVRGVSLKKVYEDYKEVRKDLKPKTLYDYDRIMTTVFSGWQSKAISDITKDMIERKHKKIGEENGPAYANLTMRFLTKGLTKRDLYTGCSEIKFFIYQISPGYSKKK